MGQGTEFEYVQDVGEPRHNGAGQNGAKLPPVQERGMQRRRNDQHGAGQQEQVRVGRMHPEPGTETDHQYRRGSELLQSHLTPDQAVILVGPHQRQGYHWFDRQQPLRSGRQPPVAIGVLEDKQQPSGWHDSDTKKLHVAPEDLGLQRSTGHFQGVAKRPLYHTDEEEGENAGTGRRASLPDVEGDAGETCGRRRQDKRVYGVVSVHSARVPASAYLRNSA